MNDEPGYLAQIKIELKNKFGVDWKLNYSRNGLIFNPSEKFSPFSNPRLIYFFDSKEIKLSTGLIGTLNESSLTDEEVKIFIKTHTRLKNFQ